MRLDIDKVTDIKGAELIREIQRLRDEYVFNTGREPNKIKMSYPTFIRNRHYLSENQLIWTAINDFTLDVHIRVYGMELEFDDNMEGVEVYDM